MGVGPGPVSRDNERPVHENKSIFVQRVRHSSTKLEGHLRDDRHTWIGQVSVAVLSTATGNEVSSLIVYFALNALPESQI
jgi:hypothetical protein